MVSADETTVVKFCAGLDDMRVSNREVYEVNSNR